jgi:hypothetical protein
MTKQHWWLGVLVIVLALAAHAALPRYDWRPVTGHPTVLVRVDRWTGRADWGVLDRATGAWRVFHDPTDKLLADIDTALREK